MTIGVIDEALPKFESGPLAHIENLGGRAWESSSNRPYLSLGSGHGEMVCSVLAATGTYAGSYEGIVPGARVVFCSAGSDTSDWLSTPRVADSIYHLAEVENCDIITFSAGDGEQEIPELEGALEDATNLGTLCFAAAGNKGQSALYPARYEDCLSSIGILNA